MEIIGIPPGEDGENALSTIDIVYSNKGKWIATSHGDHSIRIWLVGTRKQRHYLKGHKCTVSTMGFSPQDEDILVSGSLGGEIIVWDLNSNTHQRHQMEKPLAINSAAFHPHAAVVFFTQGNSIFYWEYTKSGVEELASTAHVEEKIQWLHFDPNGEYLFTGILNLHTDAETERSFHCASQRNRGGLTQQEELERIAPPPPAHTQTGPADVDFPASFQSHQSQSASSSGSQVPQGFFVQVDAEIFRAAEGRAAEVRYDWKKKRPMERRSEARFDWKGRRPMERRSTKKRPFMMDSPTMVRKPLKKRSFRVEALPQEPPASVQREEGSKLPYEDFGAAGGEPEQPGQGVPEPSATPPPPTDTDAFLPLAQALERKIRTFYDMKGIQLDSSVSDHLRAMSAGNAPPPSAQEPQPSTSWAQEAFYGMEGIQMDPSVSDHLKGMSAGNAPPLSAQEPQPSTSRAQEAFYGMKGIQLDSSVSDHLKAMSAGNAPPLSAQEPQPSTSRAQEAFYGMKGIQLDSSVSDHLKAMSAGNAPPLSAQEPQPSTSWAQEDQDVNKCNSLIGGLFLSDQPPSEYPSKELFPSLQLRGSNDAGSNSGLQPADNQDSTIQGTPPEPSAMAQGMEESARDINMDRETYCIQRWSLQQHLQITDRTVNVVVSRCKLYSMSEDGELLAVLQVCGTGLRLSVVSLATPTLGQVLYTTEHEPNAVSLNISPGEMFLLVGLHSQGDQVSEEDRTVACKLYHLAKYDERESIRLERLIRHPREFGNSASVSATSFVPDTFDGVLVGYNQPQLVRHPNLYFAPNT